MEGQRTCHTDVREKNIGPSLGFVDRSCDIRLEKDQVMLVAGHALGDNGMDSPFVGQKKKVESGS